MRVSTLLAFAVLALAAGRSHADESAAPVADFGDPEKIVVRGATVFAESTIVRELLANIDVVHAADPAAPLEEFERVLREKTVAAYRHSGFAKASAQTRLDEQLGKLVLTIAEGPCYLAGEIEISGLPEAGAAWLRDKLAAKTADDEGAASGPWTPDFKNLDGSLRWPVGKPAWCDSETQLTLQWRVEKLLFDYGLLFPECTVRLRLDEPRRQAALAIDVANCGPPASVDEIVISGHEANSREDVLKYLAIEPGMALRPYLRAELADKLARSGRFIESKVEFDKPAARGERLTMRIALTEYKKAPPLGQSLSREEAALVKLSEWLSRFNESDEEIVVTRKTRGAVVECVIAPRRGMIGMVRETADDPNASGAPFTLALVVAENRLAIYSATLQQQLAARDLASHVRAGLQVAIHNGPPKFDGQGSIGYGIHVSQGAPYRRPVHFALKDTAVALLALAHEYNAEMSWHDNVLTIWYSGRQLKLDAVSGRLLEARGGDKAGSLSIVHSSGEFARRLELIERTTSNYSNVLDGERPLTSVATFACDAWMARLHGEARAPYKVARRLLELGVLQPIDRELTALVQTSPPYFWIPPGESGRQFLGQGPQNTRFVFSYFGNRITHALVPQGAWPERLVHEAVFASLGDSRRLLDDLYYPPESAGPLWHLSGAAVSSWSQMPGASARCAREGLRRMTPEDFLRDCAGLTDTSALMGRCVANAAAALSRLDEAEAAALCQTLVDLGAIGESQRRDLAACLERLRQRPGQVGDEELDRVLETLWQLALRDRVAKALRKLAGIKPRQNLLASPPSGTNPANGQNEAAKNASKGNDLFRPSDLSGRGGKRR